MAKTALKKEVEVKKVGDGSHSHMCPRCGKTYRDINQHCVFMGLAYKECFVCTAPLGGDPFAGQSVTVVKEDDIITTEEYTAFRETAEALHRETAGAFHKASDEQGGTE